MLLQFRTVLVAVVAMTPAVAAGASGLTQQQDPGQTYRFDIPAKPLNEALADFRAVTGWTVADEVTVSAGSVTSRAVSGTLSAREALRRMLVGTGVAFDVTAGTSARLRRQPVALAGMRVTGDVNSGASYRVDRTSTATKTETPLRDVPQSVGVVTKDVIADQRMTSLAEVVRYVPGVTMAQGEGNRDQPTIRGNNSNSDLFVDGVRDDVDYFRDLYNVERVEVPKGSNALIFGRGAGGGLVNRVTKQAGWVRSQQLMIQGGRYDSKRGSIDFGRGLNDVVAVRINGMYENSGSYRNQFDLRRHGVSPTLALAVGERTRVRLGYEYFKDRRTADRGIPSFQGLPIATDPSTFFGDPAASRADVEVNAATGTVEHQASSGLTVRNNTRLAGYEKFYQNVFPGSVDATGTQVSITAYNNQINRRNLFNQTDLTYALRTGSVKHTLLAGAEVGRQSTDAYRNTGFFNNAATTLNVPVASPTFSGTPITFRQSATDADARTMVVVASAYVQDQVQLTPGILALAGVRFDNFDLEYHNNRNNADLARTDQLVSPRLGLVLKPAEPFSVYGSYSVSFLPGSGNQFTALTVTTQTLEPERFTNYEIGAKWDPRPELSLAAAVYRLDRTNTSAPDPADPTRTIQTGSQRSEGLEISGAGSVTSAWHVMVGYSYQDVKITSRTSQALAGATVPLTPHHTVSLWNKYQVTGRIGLGAGLLHQTAMFAAVDNAVTLPGFTRADAAVFFRFTGQVVAQVNVENLFDSRYYATAHSNNNITPGSPRTVRAGLTLGY